MDPEILKKLREGKVSREELVRLKEKLEKIAEELELKGQCEEASKVNFVLRLIENMLSRYG